MFGFQTYGFTYAPSTTVICVVALQFVFSCRLSEFKAGHNIPDAAVGSEGFGKK